MVVGVRGSGENNGWDKEISPIAGQITVALPQSVSLRQVYIDYASASVLSIATNGYRQYFDSISDGETRLQAVLDDSALRCPHEKWVLAGYSQGALVVNQVSRYYAGSAQLAAINLVADPEREPTGEGANYGSAGHHRGIYSVVASTVASPLPSKLSAKTLSLCDANDIVCDTTAPMFGALAALVVLGGPLGGQGVLAQARIGVRTHTSYPARDFATLQQMGAVSAAMARRSVGS